MKHSGTCQHVAHAKDFGRKERKHSTGPIRQGGTRAPGYIELEETKATPQQNASVRPCLNCSVTQGRRISAEERKHWPKAGPSQMALAFMLAFGRSPGGRSRWMNAVRNDARDHKRRVA